MVGFLWKICLVFTVVLSTDVEFITGKPVSSAKLNPRLEKYLIRYGYLQPVTKILPQSRASWDITPLERGDGKIENAIRKLQRATNLPITGKITNDEAAKIINQKRCGMKDYYTGKRTKRFILQGTSWNSKNLTYKIQSFSSDLNKEDIEKTIEKALQMWSNASQLTFTRVTTPDVNADIVIRFVSGFHGDDKPTDGPGRELAHAFFPLSNTGLAGDVHFDDDDTFAVNGGNGVDLLWLAVHELGHSLGLEHTFRSDSVMYPFYTGYNPQLQLDSDDINGIQRLYGAANLATPSPRSPPFLPDSTSQICSVKRIDAAVKTKDRNIYVFSSAHFWSLHRSGATKATRIREGWVGLEDNIDAALTRRQNGETFFFKGSKYWIFNNTTAVEGPLDISQLNLPSELKNMDAALELPRDDHAYFFKGDKYWQYNWSTASIDQGYPQIISSFWKGLPNDIDAAFQWKRGRTVILKGGEYYSLKHKGKMGIRKGFPKSFFSHWLDCPVMHFREN